MLNQRAPSTLDISDISMRFKFTNLKSIAVCGAVALVLSSTLISDNLEASRARPRMGHESDEVSIDLALPRPLKDVSQGNMLGLQFEDEGVRKEFLSSAEKYIQFRRSSSGRRATRHRQRSMASAAAAEASAMPSCSGQPASKSTIWKLFCEYEISRQSPDEGAAAKPLSLSRGEKKQLADALMSENWDAAIEVPYQSVVGSVGRIDSRTDLIHMGRSLASKRDCVGAKAATAIAYQLEVHFPEKEAVDTARNLYQYANDCGTDFAGAKAAFRLALLDIWQNKCDRVPQLMKKVEASAEANQFHSRAKYWRAYCGEVLGKAEESRDARESLLFDHPMSFQNLAANAPSDRAISWILREQSPPIALRSLVRTDLNLLVGAVESLIQLKAPDLAAEWIDRSFVLLNQMEPEVRLYLAALMHREKQPLAKFKIMSKLFQDSPRTVSSETMRMYFPLKFFEIIKPQAAELDPLLLTSLIRQESAFNINARSRVGARGLMQLMPATAKMISPVRTSKLFDPLTNVSIGTKYFKKRLGQYNGDVELTLAAYNAGFAKVDEWKKRYPTQNKILFLDLIPYKETREYVSSILRNYYWYTKLYGVDVLNGVIAHEASLTPELKKSPKSRQPAETKMTMKLEAALDRAPASIEWDTTQQDPTGLGALLNATAMGASHSGEAGSGEAGSTRHEAAQAAVQTSVTKTLLGIIKAQVETRSAN